MPVLSTPPVPRALFDSVWARGGWSPHEIQREILGSPVRNKVVALGRRAGKSQTGGHRLVPEAFRALSELRTLKAISQRREYWIVGPEYSDSEKEFRVLWNQIQKLGFPLDRPGSYNNPEQGSMSLSLFDGRFKVFAKSAKHPETLVGDGLSGVIMAEAAKLKPSVWTKYVRPTLADFGGWSMFNSTPEGRNWFYDLYMAGLDEQRPDWASWRAPSWTNPHVYPGGVDGELLDRLIEARRKGFLRAELDRIRAAGEWTGIGPTGINPEIWSLFLDMSVELFNQEIAALFTEFVGRVFKNFDEEIHVTDMPFQPGWGLYAANDYGFTNPFVWLLIQVSPDKSRVHVLDEYYEIGKTTEEAGPDIASRGLAPSGLRMFYPDPAEPDRSRTLSRLLRVPSHTRGSIPKKDRIEWIRRALKAQTGIEGYASARSPALTISPKCVNLIRELNDYRYKETHESAVERGRHAPEEPMDKDDHAPEALGRFFSGFYGKPDKTGSRQSSMIVGTPPPPKGRRR